MKKIALCAAAFALLAGQASATDLPAKVYTKAPPALPTVYDWSGFYVGINAGGGSSHECWSAVNGFSPQGPEGCYNATGGTIGGQIGYRWQVVNWVLGLEAQGNWANFRGSGVNQLTPNFNDATRIDGFGLSTGQVGYAFDKLLVYGKGGAAVVSDKYSNTLTAAGVAASGIPGVAVGQTNAAESMTRWGGTAGIGIEYAFAPHWSVALEYDHLFLGHANVNFSVVQPFGTGFSGTHSIGQDVDVGLVRVNYTFGAPGAAN